MYLQIPTENHHIYPVRFEPSIHYQPFGKTKMTTTVEVKESSIALVGMYASVEAMVESCHQDRNPLVVVFCTYIVRAYYVRSVVDTICMQQVSLLNTQNDPRFRAPFLGWTLLHEQLYFIPWHWKP